MEIKRAYIRDVSPFSPDPAKKLWYASTSDLRSGGNSNYLWADGTWHRFTIGNRESDSLTGINGKYPGLFEDVNVLTALLSSQGIEWEGK
jgi:prepilin-type processing-associated H-X9-DG protein